MRFWMILAGSSALAISIAAHAQGTTEAPLAQTSTPQTSPKDHNAGDTVATVAADQPAKPAAGKQDAMTLDTPLEKIAASEQGKAILDKHLPGLTTHAMWDAIKPMSLNEVAPIAGGAIPEDRMKLVAADLAALPKK